MYRATVRSAALELFWYQWARLQPLLEWWNLQPSGCHGTIRCAIGGREQCTKHVCRSMLGRGTVRSAALELFWYQWACLQPLVVWWDLWLGGFLGSNWCASGSSRQCSEPLCRSMYRATVRSAALELFGYQWACLQPLMVWRDL